MPPVLRPAERADLGAAYHLTACGTDLPLEVSALDSFAAVTEGPERAISIVARVDVPLARIYLGQEVLCHVLDRAGQVAEFLLDRAPAWLDEI